MVEDFSRAYNADTAENLALLDIEQLLSVHGFSCANYHLPSHVLSYQLPALMSFCVLPHTGERHFVKLCLVKLCLVLEKFAAWCPEVCPSWQ